MNSAIEKLVECLESRGLEYQLQPDKPVVYTGVSGQNGRWRCMAVAGEENDYLSFMSLLPCVVPPHRRSACAELITRINYKLTHGCFEMDFEDGEIRYRTCVPVLEGQLTSEAVNYLVFANLNCVDRFFGAIMRVVFANMPPQKALQKSTEPKPSNRRFELN